MCIWYSIIPHNKKSLMKIIVEVNVDHAPIDFPFGMNVELKKVGSKVMLLNIADDISHYLVHKAKRFNQIQFESAVKRILKKYGTVFVDDDENTGSCMNLLDLLVINEAQTMSMQETLFKANSCVVIHNSQGQIAKIWLFSH